ncbi:MAG: lipopolysaccharide heptosyltransferase family protein [Nevskia sp.]|nr:lipopolysaccharide heptosyltransferase family protein [Nevskia sp.]
MADAVPGFIGQAAGFYALTRDAKKLLVIDIGALGDTIHLLPALRLIRDNYPHAALHLVGGHPDFYAALVPWVDVRWPPMRRPFLKNLDLIRDLRRENFDAVIVITSQNRAVLIANLIGARYRLGRHTDEKKPWWWQPLLYTHTVDYPFHREPMYLQRWKMLKACGLHGEAPRFDVRLQPQWLLDCGLDQADRKTYLHLSPFYAFAGKELPMTQYVELLTTLQARYSRIVLSCGPPQRERELLAQLLERLPFKPWRVFAGDLPVVNYVALIDAARLHLGGDSGGLHVARMVGTPSVSWYQRRIDYLNWAPDPSESALHRVLYTPSVRDDVAAGISTTDLLATVDALLSSSSTAE